VISVCTPVYNGEDFLEDCIKGVLAQRYKDFEYIIVDNASTDRTAEIIEKYSSQDSRIRVFRNPSTVHVIDNFMKCAEHCSADSKWIKYALADDYLYPNCLEEMIRVGELSEDIGLVSAYRLYGSQLTNVGLPVEDSVFKGSDILKRQLMRQLQVCSSSPNTLMYRKSAFEAAGGFDNHYLHGDSELAMRILDSNDLGFSHYVLTKTGLHGARGETFSIYTGMVIREYMDFGFRRLQDYKSIEFSAVELDSLAAFYANQIDVFIAKKIAHLDFATIREMLADCPGEVKEKLRPVFSASPVRYIKQYFAELVRALRRTSVKPTFKNIKRKT